MAVALFTLGGTISMAGSAGGTCPHQVDEEGRLLEGVRPLRDDDSGRSVVHRLGGGRDEVEDLREGQARARHCLDVVDVDFAPELAEARDCSGEVSASQSCDDTGVTT